MDAPASLHFVSVWVPIIAAVLGALVGTIGGAVCPVIAGWLKVSHLVHHDRQGATPFVMNDNDTGKLREWAEWKAAECRDNAAQLSRNAEQVDNKTLFRF